MQIFPAHPRATSLQFNKLSNWFIYTLQFEKHYKVARSGFKEMLKVILEIALIFSLQPQLYQRESMHAYQKLTINFRNFLNGFKVQPSGN